MVSTKGHASHRAAGTLVLGLWVCLTIINCAHAQVGSIIQVTTTEDTVSADGFCSLREAIMASNTNSAADFSALSCQGTGIDSIRFGLGAGTPTIFIGATPLPTITDRVTIAGNTGGATRVELRGPGGNTGLLVGPTAGNSTLRFLVISNFLTAIHLQGPNAVLISSYIGPDATGMEMRGNGTGVLIEGAGVRIGGTSGTTPGGACTGECNLISGNTTVGIAFDFTLFSPDALIQGNFIGTNVLGEQGPNMGNGTGISSGLGTIGGGTAAARNVISGNTGPGIGGSFIGTVQGNYIGTNSAGAAAVPNLGGGIVQGTSGATIEGNVISGNAIAGAKFDSPQNLVLRGNFIGTAADGVTSLPNYDLGDGTGHGVWITGNGGMGNSNALLGPPANVIAFNEGDGVRVEAWSRNSIRFNSIHDNGGLGINNEAGGNQGLQPPSFTVVGAASVSGNSVCIDTCTVDVYSDVGDEGRIYEGSATVPQLTGVPWTFIGPLTGPHVTATLNDDNGNTSEFAAPVACPNFDDDDLCDALDDFDGDGVMDAFDNCITVANPPLVPGLGGNGAQLAGRDAVINGPGTTPQLDTDGDGYGNACDADLNNSDRFVNFADLALFRAVFGTNDAEADFDASGGPVNFADLARFRALFGKPPGPSSQGH